MSARETTYRVQGLPSGYSKKQVVDLLINVLQLEVETSSLDVHSLAPSPYHSSVSSVVKVATITLNGASQCLTGPRNTWDFSPPMGEPGFDSTGITIDSTFHGFTPLNDTREEGHQIDCIAITGLAGHAFASWKDRNGRHMWLRDSLPFDLKTARVLTYGYDSILQESFDSQGITEIARGFVAALGTVRQNPAASPCPLIFLAHSLGGLILKEALVQMSDGNSVDVSNFRSTYAAVFFGVPNRGLEINHLRAMVKGQPNEHLVNALAPGSKILKSLHERFRSKFNYSTSKILSCYETKWSPTVKRDGGKWMQTGDRLLLVDGSSATDSLPLEPQNFTLPISRTHSEMVKFIRYDSLYYQILGFLSSFAATAVDAIKDRTIAIQANEPRTLRWLSIEHSRGSSISLLVGPNGLEQAYQSSGAGEREKELDIHHLKPKESKLSSAGKWFASAVSALKARKGEPLDYRVPDEVLRVAKTDIIPRGVMVYLDLIKPSSAAETDRGWEQAFFDRQRDMFLGNIHDRAAADSWHRSSGREEFAAQKEWEAGMVPRALASARLGNQVVAQANLQWRRIKGHTKTRDVSRVVEEVIYKMALDVAKSESLSRMLDRWKKWTEMGELKEQDVEYIREHRGKFLSASCILSILWGL